MQEQKLYEVAASTAAALASLPTGAIDMLAEAVVNPRELIFEYIRVLSDIRGNSSYLLPKLVECSESLLRLNSLGLSPGLSASSCHGHLLLDDIDLEQDHGNVELITADSWQ